MSLRISPFAVLAACLGFASAPAAEPEKKPEVVRLAITPAAEPLPALKYQLLPKFLDRRPGNAAVDYGRAMLDYQEQSDFITESIDWLKLPPAEFDAVAKEKNLAQYRNQTRLELAKLAARCDHCDWQLPLRDQDFFSILLPEAQKSRSLARLIALEARLRLGERDYVGAVDVLQSGYALARHIAAEPTLVNGLVGLSISGMMDQVLLDFAQRSDAPSLYWALTFLPRPLIDLRTGLEGEMYALHLTFPALTEGERSPEEWNAAAQKLLVGMPQLMSMAADETQSKQNWTALLSHLAVMAKVALRRDELRGFVVRCGRTSKEVERMNDSQLLLEFTRLKYEQLRDDMFRWMTLPYAEARPGIEAAEKQLSDEKKDGGEIIPFGAVILPAVSTMKHHYARADRRHDVLRIVEALRLYANHHDGKLPQSLADLTNVPLPKIDPISSRPYEYVLDGDVARLTLPEENRGDKTALVYEITVAR